MRGDKKLTGGVGGWGEEEEDFGAMLMTSEDSPAIFVCTVCKQVTTIALNFVSEKFWSMFGTLFMPFVKIIMVLLYKKKTLSLRINVSMGRFRICESIIYHQRIGFIFRKNYE